MAEELKPCPFCGSDELSHGHASPGFNETCQGIVQCHNCDAYVLGEHEREAIAAWNTRPSPDQAVIEKGWNRMLEAAIAEFEAKGMERAKGILAYHLNREVTQPALEAERKQG